MKAIAPEQINPLDASYQGMTGFDRNGQNWDDADDSSHFYTVSKMEAIVLRKYQQALSKKLESIMGGGGGNGGSTASTNFHVGSNNSKGSQSNTGLHAGDHVNVGIGPCFLGTVTVLDFRKFNTTKTNLSGTRVFGVALSLGFTNNNNFSEYTDFNWIQTARVKMADGTTKVFNDPEIPDDDNPFYNTAKDRLKYPIRQGYDQDFDDGPSRPKEWFDQKWEGELSLVGKNKQGAYRGLITFSYGFTLSSTGNLVDLELQITNPSFFQNLSIFRAH